MRSKIVLLTATLMIMAAAMALAQSGWGEIKGFITDVEGNSIIGAQLTVTSSALMGERVATSGARGYFRIINLPPGTYKVVVKKENYAAKEFTNISVRAEKTTNYNITLEVGDFNQTIVISGEAPIIDTEATGQRYQISGEFRKSLPLNTRSSYHEVMRLLPGVVNTQSLDNTYSYYQVHGADYAYGNIFQIDGASATAWTTNLGHSTYLNMDVIEDASIQITGISASQPTGRGASINLVTKSGGNDLSGSVTLQYQPKKWNDVNIDGGTPNDFSMTQPSFSLGGPIFKDKLWFFASHRYTHILQGISRSESTVNTMKGLFPGWEPFDIDKDLHTFFSKLSYGLNDSNRFFATYQHQWGAETFGRNNYTYEALINEEQSGPLYMFGWTTMPNDRLSVNSSVSYREKPRYHKGTGTNDSPIVVSKSWYASGNEYYPSSTLAYAANLTGPYEEVADSWEIRSDATYFIEELYGSHEVEIGTRMQPYSTAKTIRFHERIPDTIYQVPIDPDDYSKGLRVWKRQYYNEEFEETTETIASNYAFYINDTWKPTSRLTISFGLRYNNIDNDDELNGNRVDVSSFTSLAPVIGATYAITADSKNIIRGSYRKSYKGFNLNIFSNSGQSYDPGEWSEYDLDGDGVFELRTDQPPSSRDPNGIDRSGQTLPYSHDFNLGYTRELPWNLSLGVDYTYRQFRNEYYTVNSNLIFENGQFVGRVDPNKYGTYVYTNNTWNWREYHGIDITLNKRFSDGFQFMAVYSDEWTELKGDWEPDNIWGYISPEVFPMFGYDGTTSAYNMNRQNGSPRGANFRFNANWHTPWHGITMSLSTLHMSGGYSGPIYHYLDSDDPEVTRFPQYIIQDGIQISNPLYTTVRFKFDTRKEGQWRAPMNHKINLRIGKEFQFRRYRLQASLDVFNLFNFSDQLYTHYSGNNYDNTMSNGEKYYGTNRGTQSPRAAQLYLRLTF